MAGQRYVAKREATQNRFTGQKLFDRYKRMPFRFRNQKNIQPQLSCVLWLDGSLHMETPPLPFNNAVSFQPFQRCSTAH